MLEELDPPLEEPVPPLVPVLEPVPPLELLVLEPPLVPLLLPAAPLELFVLLLEPAPELPLEPVPPLPLESKLLPELVLLR